MKRPFSATFMLWMGFILGLTNSWRVRSWSKQADILISYGMPATLVVVQIVGAVVWTLLWWYLTWLLWKRRAVVRFGFPITLAVYATFYSLSLRFLTASPMIQQTWFARLVVWIAGILLTLWWCRRLTKQDYWQR